MYMVPYNRRSGSIFGLMDDMERNFFGNVRGTDQFRCDISEKDGAYLLEAELPGFDKKDIHVEVKDDMLTISAAHESTDEEKDKDGNYIRRERRYGSFSRSFSTEGIDVDNIKADYKNGILNLSLPKAKEIEPQTKRIEIGS